MGSREFPLGVVQNPLIYSPYSDFYKDDFRPESETILTELGAPLETEGGANILIE